MVASTLACFSVVRPTLQFICLDSGYHLRDPLPSSVARSILWARATPLSAHPIFSIYDCNLGQACPSAGRLSKKREWTMTQCGTTGALSWGRCLCARSTTDGCEALDPTDLPKWARRGAMQTCTLGATACFTALRAHTSGVSGARITTKCQSLVTAPSATY